MYLEDWNFYWFKCTFNIALALPDDGKLIALDKNEETNKIALIFLKKLINYHKIETIIKPALESLDDLTS